MHQHGRAQLLASSRHKSGHSLTRTSALLLGIFDPQQPLPPGTRRTVTPWFVIYVSLSPDIAW